MESYTDFVDPNLYSNLDFEVNNNHLKALSAVLYKNNNAVYGSSYLERTNCIVPPLVQRTMITGKVSIN